MYVDLARQAPLRETTEFVSRIEERGSKPTKSIAK